MKNPSKLEWIILLALTVIYTAYNVHKSGWGGLLENKTVFGGLVAGWVWCLIFHRTQKHKPLPDEPHQTELIREAHSLLNSHEITFRLPAVPWRDRRDEWNKSVEKVKGGQ